MKIKKAAMAAVVIYLIIYMICSPQSAITVSKNALLICANVLVPSLLPFFIFSGILIRLGFANLVSRPMSHIMRPLFGVSGAGAVCFVLGIVSGYPMGASCVCDMYNEGMITKRDGERLLAFCNNSGPLFVMGAVGGAMYMSREIGMLLYLVHIFSAVAVGIVLGISGRKKEHAAADRIPLSCSKPVGVIIKEAVCASVNNMLMICALTVVFSLVINALSESCGWMVSLFAGGFVEISSGIYNVSISPLSLAHKLTLTSAMLAFAGVSVHLQVAAVVSGTDLSLKMYFAGKALQAVFASVFAWIILHSSSVPTYMGAYYPIMPYEVIDFASAFKLALLYIASAMIVIVVLWLIEKVCEWQERVKYGKRS